MKPEYKARTMRFATSSFARVLLAGMLSAAACSALGRGGDRNGPLAMDLNTAPVHRIETLPGVTPSMARRIVEGRPYASPDELVERGILTERELGRVHDQIIVNRAH
jgi:hypothetical protein